MSAHLLGLHTGSTTGRLVGSRVDSESSVSTSHSTTVKSAGSVSVLLVIEFDKGSTLELSVLILHHSDSYWVYSLLTENFADILLFRVKAKVANKHCSIFRVRATAALSLLRRTTITSGAH